MIKGIIIGIGVMLPGVSGGVLAVILGVYDKLIYSIKNIKNSPKTSLKYLIPIIFGIIIGIIISSKLLIYVFNKYYIEACYLFIGLVIGTIPYLINSVKIKTGRSINYNITLLTLVFLLILTILYKDNISINNDITSVGIIKLLVTGFLYAMGKIVPGLSSSLILNIIGMYDIFLNIMANPFTSFINNTNEIAIIIFGFIIGCIFFVYLMGKLLSKYYIITYSIIISFILLSIITMIPRKISIIGIILMILGIYISKLLSKYN